MQPRLIMFDIGGVLVEISNTAYFNYLSKESGISSEEVERRLNIDVAPFEKGAISLKLFAKAFAEDLGIAQGKILWAEYFKKIARLNQGTAEIVRELSKGYALAYLSNVDEARYTYVRDVLLKGIIGLFSYEFASFRMKCTKPSPKIYSKAISVMKLNPADIIFIDNDYRNVEAARGMGIRAILFTRSAPLRKELKQLGVKI